MAEMTGMDAELEAIKRVIEALTSLDETARQRVLKYAMEHLGMSSDAPPPLKRSEVKVSTNTVVDIRTLRDEKKPSSDVQMTTLVAYYLAELAPEEERKGSMTTKDLTKYFKQAGHPLPNEPKYTLVNARNAGYLESAGSGAYTLNPVGHNLVVHTLPKATGGGTAGASTRSTKKGKTRASKATPKKASRSKKGK